uniref:Uncharacterized protein n=1 Tax=Sinocyclocheilus rhinocerous TaxID=307959 RepID=A0A673GF66_9TELE
MGCKDCSGICLQCLFDYETPVMLVIKTKRVGALFRLIQLYVCWIQRAYQDTDSVISSVSTKVKGNILTNSFTEGVHVLGHTRICYPTPGQTQSKCPEIPSEFAKCESDSDCKEGLDENPPKMYHGFHKILSRITKK